MKVYIAHIKGNFYKFPYKLRFKGIINLTTLFFNSFFYKVSNKINLTYLILKSNYKNRLYKYKINKKLSYGVELIK